jgi:hypothetical protein
MCGGGPLSFTVESGVPESLGLLESSPLPLVLLQAVMARAEIVEAERMARTT